MTRWDLKRVVGKPGTGPVSTGMAITAESKARRTARMLAEVEAVAAEGRHLGPKARLWFGIKASAASLAISHARAEAVGRCQRSVGSLAPPLKHKDVPHQPAVARGRLGTGVGPTHPSRLDKDLAADEVNWRPCSSRIHLQHLPGYSASGKFGISSKVG